MEKNSTTTNSLGRIETPTICSWLAREISRKNESSWPITFLIFVLFIYSEYSNNGSILMVIEAPHFVQIRFFVHFHRPRHMGSGFEFGTGTTYACC